MNNSNNGDIVKLLWTGGWDSTFRLVELSRQNVTVQPIYLFGDSRASEKLERIAMSKIIELLKQKPSTKANILPILYINISDIEPDEEISEAYRAIRDATNLGSQHEWIAWYAKINPGLEIGTEENSPEDSRIINSLKQFTVLRETNG